MFLSNDQNNPELDSRFCDRSCYRWGVEPPAPGFSDVSNVPSGLKINHLQRLTPLSRPIMARSWHTQI